VKGNVHSNGQVVLGKESKLQGDIVYRKLLIEDGAKFEGKCDLIGIEEKT
jgi:Integral membrane protein CcmA involved in cell shape determination